ncbi:MAG: hypothetical protein JJV97_02230 [SAR324 cluster bacterium]|nr:hypothetical protein [SAR324 cluster bacterium]
MNNYFYALDHIPEQNKFKAGDLFILCGELFGRGYASGLVNAAKKANMKIIGFSVGRREKGVLRKLTTDELEKAQENLGGEIINLPLEAGFDLEKVNNTTIVDLLNTVKLNNWQDFDFDSDLVEKAIKQGQARFKKTLQEVISIVEKKHQSGQNIHFAHIMAGGIPRAKIMMLITNRVFRSQGERYIPSADLWNSKIGKLVELSFNEVTADTFSYLIEATKNLRATVAKGNKEVSYSSYGYHGSEILIDDAYSWQTYNPYQQGHAKKRLERHAIAAREKGIKATVFNCPEIRTNSSDVFIGVELSLLPFLHSLKKECSANISTLVWENSIAKLSPDVSLESILAELNDYFTGEIMKPYRNFDDWPLENNHDLAELMVGTSKKVTGSHINRNDLIVDYLSQIIIRSSGQLIFNSSLVLDKPVVWLGHKVLAQNIEQINLG